MGTYINTRSMPKEAWAKKNCKPVTFLEAAQTAKKDPTTLPLAMVDNGAFHALAVGFSPQELCAFNGDDDPRLVQFFIAKRADLEALIDSGECEDFRNRLAW